MLGNNYAKEPGWEDAEPCEECEKLFKEACEREEEKRMKLEWKPYRCTRCGHIQSIQTNHYGECYSPCKECSWKHPGEPSVMECAVPLEERPEDAWMPEPWKIAKLGDLAEIKETQ